MLFLLYPVAFQEHTVYVRTTYPVHSFWSRHGEFRVSGIQSLSWKAHHLLGQKDTQVGHYKALKQNNAQGGQREAAPSPAWTSKNTSWRRWWKMKIPVRISWVKGGKGFADQRASINQGGVWIILSLWGAACRLVLLEQKGLGLGWDCGPTSYFKELGIYLLMFIRNHLKVLLRQWPIRCRQ